MLRGDFQLETLKRNFRQNKGKSSEHFTLLNKIFKLDTKQTVLLNAHLCYFSFQSVDTMELNKRISINIYFSINFLAPI